MCNRKIIPQSPLCLDAKDPVKMQSLGEGSVEVPSLCRLLCKTSVVNRQILLQELICLNDATNPPEPHLLNQPVLKGIEEPLNSSFGLGCVSMDLPLMV